MLKGDAGEPTDEQTQSAVGEYMQQHPEAAIDETIINSAVDDWLDDHPEATTTVQDGSLTEAKFSSALKLKAIKDYVTPEMFNSISDMYTYAYQNDLSVVINKDITVNGIVTILTDTRSYNNAKFTAQGFILEGDATVEGIQFISSMVASGADEDVLLGTYGNDTIIRDCIFEFTNDNGNALAIKGSSGRIVVENCIFNKCSTNFTQCKFVTITNCTFDMQFVNTGHECIQFTAKTAGIISNNQFYNSENDFIDLFSAGSDCVISGNTFDGCHSHNMIELKTTIRDDEQSGSGDVLGWCRRNIITNNHFRNLIAQSGGIFSFIGIVAVKDGDIQDDINYYPGETIITNNIFEKCSTTMSGGVYFYAVNCCARNVIIKGNKMTINESTSTGRTSCIFVGPNGASASDTFWNLTANILVDSNILGGNSYGVSVRHSKNVTVSNNVEETGHAFKRFISVDGSNDGLKITNNICNKGTYVSFSFAYITGTLTNFALSNNATDSTIAMDNGALTNGIISNNILSLTAQSLLLTTMVLTSVTICNNVFKGTSYGIYASACTFSNTLISGNVEISGSIIRLLNPATETLPIMIGNVSANAENNNIRTT